MAREIPTHSLEEVYSVASAAGAIPEVTAVAEFLIAQKGAAPGQVARPDAYINPVLYRAHPDLHHTTLLAALRGAVDQVLPSTPDKEQIRAVRERITTIVDVFALEQEQAVRTEQPQIEAASTDPVDVFVAPKKPRKKREVSVPKGYIPLGDLTARYPDVPKTILASMSRNVPRVSKGSLGDFVDPKAVSLLVAVWQKEKAQRQKERAQARQRRERVRAPRPPREPKPKKVFTPPDGLETFAEIKKEYPNMSIHKFRRAIAGLARENHGSQHGIFLDPAQVRERLLAVEEAERKKAEEKAQRRTAPRRYVPAEPFVPPENLVKRSDIPEMYPELSNNQIGSALSGLPRVNEGIHGTYLDENAVKERIEAWKQAHSKRTNKSRAESKPYEPFTAPPGLKKTSELATLYQELSRHQFKEAIRGIAREDHGSQGKFVDPGEVKRLVRLWKNQRKKGELKKAKEAKKRAAAKEAKRFHAPKDSIAIRDAIRLARQAGIPSTTARTLFDNLTRENGGKNGTFIDATAASERISIWVQQQPQGKPVASSRAEFAPREGYIRDTDILDSFPLIPETHARRLLRSVPRQNGGPHGVYVETTAARAAFEAYLVGQETPKPTPETPIPAALVKTTLRELIAESGLPRAILANILDDVKLAKEGGIGTYDQAGARRLITEYKDKKALPKGVSLINGKRHVSMNYLHLTTGISFPTLRPLMADVPTIPNESGIDVMDEEVVEKILQPVLAVPRADKTTGIYKDPDTGEEWAPRNVATKIVGRSNDYLSKHSQGLVTRDLYTATGRLTPFYRIADLRQIS